MFQLSNRRAVNELFSNITWATQEGENYLDEEILHHWTGPHKNLYVTLALFIVMRVNANTVIDMQLCACECVRVCMCMCVWFDWNCLLLQFWMTALAITLPVPAGVFMPVFTIGETRINLHTFPEFAELLD